MSEMQMQFDCLTIEKSFKNFYIVPDYQREYVWQDRQVEQLLNDIVEAYSVNNQKEYFLGSVVVYKNSDGVLELIDGQQRITTFFLTICAFRKIYKDRNIESSLLNSMVKDQTIDKNGDPIDRYKIRLQYTEAVDYIERIAGFEVYPSELTNSGARLFSAYNFAVDFLDKTFQSEDLIKKFFAYFYFKIRFIQIQTQDIGDALKIFETINQRGVGLNPMDLVKNMIFRQVEKSQFTELNLKWKSINDKLESISEKPLRFLRYFVMSNYDVSDMKSGIVREDNIYDWFASNVEKCDYTKKPFEFVELLDKNASAYVSFINGKDQYGNNVNLKNIIGFGGGAYRLHLLLLLPARNLPKELFVALSKTVESIIYYAIMTRKSANELERIFAGWAQIIRGIHNADDYNSFIKKQVNFEMKKWQEIYQNLFMEIGLNSMQKYRIRYILARITQHIDLMRQGSFSLQGLDGYVIKGIEIEHIMPETPNEDLKQKYSSEKYSYMVTKIGNLTLLEKSINCSVSNGSFYAVKKEAYKQSKFYLTKSIAQIDSLGSNTAINRVNEKLQSWSDWTLATIKDRQQILLNLSKDIWKIDTIALP